MTAVATPLQLRHLDRRAVQAHLPTLSAWLLPGCTYGVQHTWPQLYRSDGGGTFLALLDGDERLVGHCAFRRVRVRGARSTFDAALLGSVAVDPERRGCGHAGRLLAAAVEECTADGADAILLWAERPELYARAGFGDGPPESCALLARRPHPAIADVRLATVADHRQLTQLHARKPLAVERTERSMSGLLTTPGLWTYVRAVDDQVVAYACTGKGADLQGFWHELGGDDAEVASLLPVAMAARDQCDAHLLVPPWRQQLLPALGAAVRDVVTVSGPMVRWLRPEQQQQFWIDGLDSV